MKLSIIIPVYCGELTLEPLFSAIKKAISSDYDYEVIFVWDCGPDNSWDVICRLKESAPNIIKAIKLSRNFGQHNAIICGIKFAKGDFIITMDEDLQHDPADIKKLIKKQKERDYDVVYGQYNVRNHNLWRNFTSYILKILLKIGIPSLPSGYTAFRLIKKDMAIEICKMRNSYTFLDGYLSWVTSNYGFCTIKHRERLKGESGYTLIKLIEHSINIFITFSNLPIRLLIISAFIIFFFSIVYSFYVIIRSIFYADFQLGFPTLIIVLLMGVSFMLLGLGVIGEYIFRINQKTTKRPNYKIGEIK